MPTPPTIPDALFRGKATLVNPRSLTQPHANNYGQAVVAGQRSELPGFTQSGAGSPMSPTANLRRWVKIGHLSQGRGNAQKTTPGVLGPHAGFR